MLEEKCEMGLRWTSEEWYNLAKRNRHFLPEVKTFQPVKSKSQTPTQRTVSQIDNTRKPTNS